MATKISAGKCSQASDGWAQTPSWSSLPSKGGLSRTDSCTSFATLDSELDAIPASYSNLWEIQLQLGEIPDMISNNLLEPCSPLLMGCSGPERAFPFEGHVVMSGQTQGKAMAWPSDVSSETKPPEKDDDYSLPAMFFLSLKEDLTTGVGHEQEYGDGQDEGEYEDEDEDVDQNEREKGESRRDAAVNHPVYGMMLSCSSLEVQGGEFRHDRKDSGVFMHSGLDEDLLNDCFGRSELEAKAFPVAVEQSKAAGHRHSAAYASLQRIASSFSNFP